MLAKMDVGTLFTKDVLSKLVVSFSVFAGIVTAVIGVDCTKFMILGAAGTVLLAEIGERAAPKCVASFSTRLD